MGNTFPPPTTPRCETCPLWRVHAKGELGNCHLSGRYKNANTVRSWYCEHHPDMKDYAFQHVAWIRHQKEEQNDR